MMHLNMAARTRLMLQWQIAEARDEAIGDDIEWIAAALNRHRERTTTADAQGNGLEAVCRKALDRLTVERETGRAFVSRVEMCLGFLPDTSVESTRAYYAEGLSTQSVAERTYYSERQSAYQRETAAAAVYVAMLAMESIAPTGYYWLQAELAGKNIRRNYNDPIEGREEVMLYWQSCIAT